LALVAALSLRTLLPDPGAESLTRVNAAETPVGNPVTERAIAALNPPLMVTLKCALLFDPAVIEMVLDDRAAWKLGTIMASFQWLTRTNASIEPKPVAWS
jgi:hypothetical protein